MVGTVQLLYVALPDPHLLGLSSGCFRVCGLSKGNYGTSQLEINVDAYPVLDALQTRQHSSGSVKTSLFSELLVVSHLTGPVGTATDKEQPSDSPF